MSKECLCKLLKAEKHTFCCVYILSNNQEGKRSLIESTYVSFIQVWFHFLWETMTVAEQDHLHPRVNTHHKLTNTKSSSPVSAGLTAKSACDTSVEPTQGDPGAGPREEGHTSLPGRSAPITQWACSSAGSEKTWIYESTIPLRGTAIMCSAKVAWCGFCCSLHFHISDRITSFCTNYPISMFILYQILSSS